MKFGDVAGVLQGNWYNILAFIGYLAAEWLLVERVYVGCSVAGALLFI